MFNDAQNQGGNIRHLPVYLLLDTSGSMAGEKISAVNQGLQLMYSTLLDNPQAVDTAHLCVISFDSSAQIVVPFTDVMNFQPPTLAAGGVTRLADALDLLNKSIEKDVRENTQTQKGDYKPLVFIFTDGIPTDSSGNPSTDWMDALKRLRDRKTKKVGTIIVLAVGSDDQIDENVMKNLGNVALRMQNVNSDAIQSYFQWMSASMGVVSVNAQANQGQAPINLPQLPQESGIQVVI